MAPLTARDRVLEALEKAGCGRPKRGMVACPLGHDHDTLSLHVTYRDGRVLLWCHGCETPSKDIAATLGLTLSDLFDEPLEKRPTGREIRTWYDYTDATGQLVYQVGRRVNKQFTQRRPDPAGKEGWAWNLDGVDRVPYRLPKVVDAVKAGRLVWVVEGEKDVETLELLGQTATCNSGGAGKWPDSFAQWLVGGRVAICADRDPAGRAHALHVWRTLAGVADDVLCVEPVAGKDVTDHVAAGHGLADLVDVDPEDWATTDTPPSAGDEELGPGPESDVLERPAIVHTDRQLPDVTADALAALEAANVPPRDFRTGTALARVVIDDRGDAAMQLYGRSSMRGRLARTATWWKERRRKDGETDLTADNPPLEVVDDVLALPDPPFPPVDRIVEAPVLAADGTIRVDAGYDPKAKVYRPDRGHHFTAPDNPTTTEITAARTLIVDDLLGDFPFTTDSDRAHAVALLLLPFVRAAIPGPTPLHLIEAPSPGTGKDLLVEAAVYPALGRGPAVMVEGRDEDEWRKRITSVLISGAPVVLLDNLRRRLDVSALAAAITATIWEDRLLGLSRQIRLPVQAVWTATANNPGLSSEMVRRTLRIRIDARTDRPWLRTGFRHPNLRRWAKTNRPQLVSAALTLARAWVCAGRPESPIVLGQFEDWSHTMGGILSHAGIPGFLANLDDFYDQADDELAGWRNLVTVWWERHGTNAVGTAQLAEIVEDVDTGLDLGRAATEQGRRTRLGILLKTQRDRRFGAYTITAGTKHQGALQWQLREEVNGKGSPSSPLTPEAEAEALMNQPGKGSPPSRNDNGQPQKGSRGSRDSNNGEPREPGELSPSTPCAAAPARTYVCAHTEPVGNAHEAHKAHDPTDSEAL